MLHRSLPRVLLGLLCFTGCSELSAESSSESASEPAPLTGDKDQSRWLLGGGLDQLPGFDLSHHYAVGTVGRDAADNSVTLALDLAASLRGTGPDGVVHKGDDPWFNTIRLPGPDGSELRLGVIAHAGLVSRYEIRRRLSVNAPWADPCAGGQARVLAGVVTRTGAHEVDPGKLTFACTDGVAAKCIDWGYTPGGASGSRPWKVHQACTRMGRGDYCADGTPHTRNGTYIQTYDVDGAIGASPLPPATWPELTEWPPPHTEFYFEAAWRADRPALCLSRLRWQSLPLGPQCSGQLPDPREDAVAKFCDHQSSDDLIGRGALLFNTSRYNDIKLQRWQNGNDRVTTVRGYEAAPDTEIPGEPPFAPSYQYTGGDGSLLRSLPADRDLSEVAQVSMFKNVLGDHVLGLTASPPPGYAPATDQPIEGLVLVAPSGNDTIPLRMCQHPTTGDRVSETVCPTSYVEESVLGHILLSE